jgi:hypothetical protein
MFSLEWKKREKTSLDLLGPFANVTAIGVTTMASICISAISALIRHFGCCHCLFHRFRQLHLLHLLRLLRLFRLLHL